MKELARVPIFQGVSDSELDQLGSLAKKSTFKAGTVVFFEGDRADSLYVVLAGSAKVYRTTADGQVKILATITAGETLGELTLLDGRHRSATVETLEPTKMLSISHRDFREFVDRNPGIMWKVVQSLCDRLRDLNQETLHLAFEELPYRVVHTLTMMAGGKASLRVAPQQLAHRVGVEQRALRRVVEMLSKRGLVQLELDEIVVPDSRALERSLEYAREWY
jgi:CRP-like cAMP-binding protein